MSEAANFMRDNISGGLVVSANVRKDGKIRYKMEEGHSYLIDATGIETLSRYNFKPRFHPKFNTPVEERSADG